MHSQILLVKAPSLLIPEVGLKDRSKKAANTMVHSHGSVGYFHFIAFNPLPLACLLSGLQTFLQFCLC